MKKIVYFIVFALGFGVGWFSTILRVLISFVIHFIITLFKGNKK